MSLFKRCAHTGRLRDDCAHAWWSAIKHQGRKFRVSLETEFNQPVRGRGSKTLAAHLDRQFREKVLGAAAVEAPGLPLPVDKRTVSFRAFVDIYKTHYVDVKGLRSWGSDRKYKVAKFVELWGDREIGSIALDDVEAFIATLKRTRVRGEGDGRAASTVRRWYAALHQLFGWAESRGFVDRSPIGRKNAIELEPEDNERTRRPTADELTAILQHAGPLMRDMVTVALETGLRQGTLRQLTGAMVDWTPGPRHFGLLRVPSRAVKNRKLFVMPMTRHTAAILQRRYKALEERRDAHLFGNEVGERLHEKVVWGLWNDALVAAGLKSDTVDPDLHFHDLRAEFASQLIERGEPLDRVRRLLGHSTLMMTQRYLRSRGLDFEDYGAAEESIAARVVRTGTRAPLKLVTG